MTTRIFALSLAFLLLCSSLCCAQGPASAVAPVELQAKNGGRVWVYVPANRPANAKLPCVLIPPAGSRLFHGMRLGEGDVPEHLPWVAAGFAVVSFDISGPWNEKNRTSLQPAALSAFMQAKLGVSDAMAAAELAFDKYPQLDPKRLYVAGHSSAATLALQLAVAASDQIKACVAFAPVTNLDDHLKQVLPILDRSVPGFGNAIHLASPLNRVEGLQCPVFLFHALDDNKVSTQSVEAYRDALLAHHKTVEYVSVGSGGHHDSMIEEGIPQAILWLTSIDRNQAKQ